MPSPEHIGRWEFWCITIVFPAVLVLIMNAWEDVLEQTGLLHRLPKVGWDLCVFALGGIGGVLLDNEVRGALGIGGILFWFLASMCVSFGALAWIARIRHGTDKDGNKREATGFGAFVGILLGAAAVSVPSALAAVYKP
jgi:hypothetical protein